MLPRLPDLSVRKLQQRALQACVVKYNQAVSQQATALRPRSRLTWDLFPLWFYLFSNTPDNTDHVTRLLQGVTRVEPYTVVIYATRAQYDDLLSYLPYDRLVLTPLTASLLCGRFDVWDAVFDHWWRRERRHNSVFGRQPHQTGHQDQLWLSVWFCLPDWGLLNPWWRMLRVNDPTGENVERVTRRVAQVLVLLRGTPWPSVGQYMMDQVAEALSHSPHQYTALNRFIERCGELVRGYGGLTAYVPPLPCEAWIPQWPAERVKTTAQDLQSLLVERRIYQHFVEQPLQGEFQRWAAVHLPRLLHFMDCRLKSFMYGLLPRRASTTPARPASAAVQYLEAGYVFLVEHSHCSEQYVNQQRHCLISMDHRRFILNKADMPETSSYWLVVCAGVEATESTHPWLRQHLASSHGAVTRRTFGTIQSAGLIWPYQQVAQFYPELDRLTQHPHDGPSVQDVTGLFRLQRRRRRTPRRPSLARRAVPWAASCVLQLSQLRRLAPTFATFSPEQRYLFYWFFWNVDATTTFLFPWTLKAWRQNWVSLWEDGWDWQRVEHRAELRSWVQVPPTHRAQQLVFNTRWQAWLPYVSKSLQALHLLQTGASPLLVLVQQVSVQRGRSVEDRTVMGEVCRLSHRLQMVWTLLVETAHEKALLHNLVRLFVAPELPPEIRRLAWHSLTRLCAQARELLHFPPCLDEHHPYFPPSSYPLLTREEVAALPRVFVDLRTPLVEKTHTLLFQRVTPVTGQVPEFLCTDPDLLRATAVDETVSPLQYDLAFAGEPGHGPAVIAEVLQHLWSAALRDRMVRMLDEDHTLCVAEHPGVPACRFWELGFVSGLGLSLGYYLPYPLHTGWWRSLFSDVSSSDSMCRVFAERVADRLQYVRSLTPAQRHAAFVDLVSPHLDPASFTDEELVVECLLPSPLALEAFQAGWNVCMSTVKLDWIFSHLNAVFCEQQHVAVSVERVEAVFQVREPRDRVFLAALRRLPLSQLQQLVHFITGKTRLPLLEQDEERLQVVWNAAGTTLPRAQNCTNTLLLPPLPVPVTAEHVLTCLRPLFEFETVYGFL